MDQISGIDSSPICVTQQTTPHIFSSSGIKSIKFHLTIAMSIIFILNKYKYIKFFISLNYFLLPMCGILGHKEAHLLLNVIIKFFTPFFSLSMPAPLPVKMTYLILMTFFTCQIQTQLKIADGFSKIRSKIIIQKWILGQLRANFPWKFGKSIYPCKKNP